MPQGRKLTHAERSLWEYVFGKALTEANVEVVRRPRTMHSGGFTPYCRVNMDGNAYQADYFRDDDMFRPRSAADAHHFLHELSHCWQHLVGMGMLHLSRLAQREGREVREANGMARRPAGMTRQDWRDVKFESVYHYDITAGSDLMDFTLEHQCDIIADYFAWTLWRFPLSAKAWGYPTPTQIQLETVLSAFRANPSYPRYLTRINKARADWRNVER